MSRYIRDMTNGRKGEKDVKYFLARENPLDCGRYVCGVKISDGFRTNNGGWGGGKTYKLLYDKEAILQGMREKGIA